MHHFRLLAIPSFKYMMNFLLSFHCQLHHHLVFFQIPIISMYIIHIGILYIYISTFRYYLKVYGIYWSTWIILDTILRLCIYVIRPQFAIYDDINVMSIHHHPPHSSAPAPCICPPCPSKSGPRRVAVEGSGRCVHPGATDQGWWIWWQWVNVAWKWRLKRMAFFRVMKHI